MYVNPGLRARALGYSRDMERARARKLLIFASKETAPVKDPTVSTFAEIVNWRSRVVCIAGKANTCTKADQTSGVCNGNNARISVNRRNKTACIRATRNILPGEEVFVSYGRSFKINKHE